MLQQAGARSPQVSAAPGLFRNGGVASCVGERRQIAERTVRPFGVVVAPPFLELGPRLGELVNSVSSGTPRGADH